MDDLLKEAIADAKAVRETALENAKMALEEAFTPRLQSMLSKKIQTELEDDEDEYGDEEEMGEPEMDAEPEIDMEPEDEEPEEGMDMEGVIEINGVKYAPVIEQEEEGEENPFASDEDEEEENPFGESDDLDLEAVIKELEAELDEAGQPEAAKGQTPGMPDDVDESKDEVDEQSSSSGIGKGTGVKAASASDEEDPGKGKLKEAEDKEVDEDNDIDLDEVLKALSEEEDEEEEKNEVSKLRSDLDEHRSVIETLRGKLNEVNLLNAKLLFTNKLFRKYGLNNEQKMKVVEQFDRAGTLREVKLVYSTLGESFGTARNNINESKGSASKPIASTKSEKKVISEGNELRDRFKKLANLI
jgi:hypothetical protein